MLNEVVNFLLEKGFVFRGSEIYNGFSNTYDYGPYAVEILDKIKNIWKQFYIKDEKSFLIDTNIFLKPDVWKSSKHTENFIDKMIDCKKCRKRFRADHLNLSLDFSKTKCPNCKSSNWSDIKNFNLMFKTNYGPVDDNSNEAFLRPEIAQGIIINFKNIMDKFSPSLPFGIGQIGIAFRNEITPSYFLFRTRTFTMMELEYFCYPKDSQKYIEHFKLKTIAFLKRLGFKDSNFIVREQSLDELAHYSNKTYDVEYKINEKFYEIAGIASRQDFDLKAHQNATKKKLGFFDQESKKRIIPHIVEPSIGLDRIFFFLLIDSYDRENRKLIFKNHNLAPIQIAILPIVKKLTKKAISILEILLSKFSHLNLQIFEKGTIGKRYKKMDEIGTPFCITIDDKIISEEVVFIRDNKTSKQVEVKVDNLLSYFGDIF